MWLCVVRLDRILLSGVFSSTVLAFLCRRLLGSRLSGVASPGPVIDLACFWRGSQLYFFYLCQVDQLSYAEPQCFRVPTVFQLSFVTVLLCHPSDSAVIDFFVRCPLDGFFRWLHLPFFVCNSVCNFSFRRLPLLSVGRPIVLFVYDNLVVACQMSVSVVTYVLGWSHVSRLHLLFLVGLRARFFSLRLPWSVASAVVVVGTFSSFTVNMRCVFRSFLTIFDLEIFQYKLTPSLLFMGCVLCFSWLDAFFFVDVFS